MRNSDRLFFDKIHNLAGKSKLLDLCGIFCAKYLMYVFLIGYGLFVFSKAGAGMDSFFRPLTIAILARFFVAGIIHVIFPRQRPFVALEFKPLVRERFLWQNASFPSGHTTFLFAFITVLLVAGHPYAAWFYILGVAVGLARIYAGVHWPSDIIGGAIIGIAAGFSLMPLFNF